MGRRWFGAVEAHSPRTWGWTGRRKARSEKVEVMESEPPTGSEYKNAISKHVKKRTQLKRRGICRGSACISLILCGKVIEGVCVRSAGYHSGGLFWVLWCVCFDPLCIKRSTTLCCASPLGPRRPSPSSIDRPRHSGRAPPDRRRVAHRVTTEWRRDGRRGALAGLLLRHLQAWPLLQHEI